MENVSVDVICEFEVPYGMVIDSNGILYYTNQDGLWSMDIKNPQKRTRLISRGYLNLRTVIWNGNHLLYMTTTGYDIIEYNLKTGETNSVITNNSHYVSDPPGIAIQGNRYLYVTDSYERIICKIRLSNGSLTTFAGSPKEERFIGSDVDETPQHQDGRLNEAQFESPSGITVAHDGTIYVADSENFCIRKIKKGIVSTVAGVPGKAGNENGPLNSALFDYFSHSPLIMDNQGCLLVISGYKRLSRIDFARNRVTTVLATQVSFISTFTLDNNGVIYAQIGEYLVRIESSWKWERFLWLAKIKEDPSYCLLAQLPVDIVRVISSLFRSLPAACFQNPTDAETDSLS